MNEIIKVNAERTLLAIALVPSRPSIHEPVQFPVRNDPSSVFTKGVTK